MASREPGVAFSFVPLRASGVDPWLTAPVARNDLLLDTKELTVWRDADGAFQFCVGQPHDFRSATVPETLMLAFLRNLDALIGSGSAS